MFAWIGPKTKLYVATGLGVIIDTHSVPKLLLSLIF
jgi:hypothetical protein